MLEESSLYNQLLLNSRAANGDPLIYICMATLRTRIVRSCKVLLKEQAYSERDGLE